MAITFDGPNKRIVLGALDTTLAATTIYSRWKDWVATSDNQKYLQAFITVGGDPLGNDIYITPYYFLTNGWKIRPASQNYQLVLTENLLTDDNSTLFSFPSGYTIEVVRQFALKTETVDEGDPFTTELETGITREQAIKILLAVLGNQASGLNSNTSTTFKSFDGTKDRVVATVSAGGSRSITSVDLT